MEHLVISITQLPFELFTQKAFTVPCTLRSVNRTIKVTVLIDTGATGYAFVNFSFARVLCEILQIEPSPLVKPKTVKAFNGKPTEWITHGVYPCLEVAGHCESTAPLMITNLGNHQTILGLPWLEAHGVVADFAAKKTSIQASPLYSCWSSTGSSWNSFETLGATSGEHHHLPSKPDYCPS